METILKDYIEAQMREMDEHVDLDVGDDLVAIGFDSIAYVRLIAFIEDRFGLSIPDSEVTIEHFGTIGNIAAYLEGSGVTVKGGGAG